jgi:hypothetical protein
MDKLVASELGRQDANEASCLYCGMAKTTTKDNHCGNESKGCCKDEQKQVKVDNDQKTSEVSYNLSKPVIQLDDHTLFPELLSHYIFSTAIAYPSTHAPPRAENVSLTVRNCVFRI